MDNFMDRLAKRFNAGEMIKANAQAEARDMKRLQERAAEYEKMMQEMRRLNLKNVEVTEQVQQLIQCGIEQFEGYGNSDRYFAEQLELLKEQLSSVKEDAKGNEEDLNKIILAFQAELQKNNAEIVDSIKANNAEISDSIKANNAEIIDGIKANNAEISDSIKANNAEIIDGIKANNAEIIDSIKANNTEVIDSIKANNNDIILGIRANNTDLVESIKEGNAEVLEEIRVNTSEANYNVSKLVSNTDLMNGQVLVLEEGMRRMEFMLQDGLNKGIDEEALAPIINSVNEMQAVVGSLRTSIEEGNKHIEEHVHRENVRVYRNVQAVVVDETSRHARELHSGIDHLEDAVKRGNTKVISILTFILALAAVGIEVVKILGIF